jgi:amino-acid N-acetyltransferase
MDVTIQPAAPTDMAAIRRLLERSALPASDLDSAPLRLWVGRAGSAVIGVIGLEVHGTVALLRSLAVDGSHRGLGTGRGLLLTAEQHARGAWLKSIVLLTTTATAYFESLGYRRIEREQAPAAVQRHPQFHTLCPASAVCMVKHLA